MAAVHPNYIKSSNLIFLSILVGLLSLAIAQEPIKTLPAVLGIAVNVIFLGAIAFGIRRGISWIKYILLIVFLAGLATSILLVVNKHPAHTGAVVVNIVQTLVQLWALILLFTIPKTGRK